MENTDKTEIPVPKTIRRRLLRFYPDLVKIQTKASSLQTLHTEKQEKGIPRDPLELK